MEHDILPSVARLRDAELVAQVKTLIARERGVTSELIAHLAELDTRDVHLREGYTSLFVYCRDALGLSEWEAYNRIEVARAARRFPVILEMLAEGAVNLTTVRLLAPHLTPGNHREVLDSSRGKRKLEVEEIVARLAPRPDARSFVRRVPTRPSEPAATTEVVHVLDAPAAPLPEPLSAVSSAGFVSPTDRVTPMPSPLVAAALEPLSPTATSYSSRSATRPSRSCAWPRTCSATPSPRATTPRSWTGPSRRCWWTWRRGSLPIRPSRAIQVEGNRGPGLRPRR